MKREFEDFTLEYDDSDASKAAVFDKLIAWYVKHESFCGESICQSDEPTITAPMVLSDIADELFTVSWKE